MAGAERARTRPPSTLAPTAAATATVEHLETIRKILRTAAWAHAQRLRVPLTAPQLLAVQVLADEARTSGSELSLSELSRRLGLAHSTVSGIVSRLEARGLVQRLTRPDDRRFVTIRLTEPVQEWLRSELPASRSGPVAAALAAASARERQLVLDGLATLRRLLEAEAPESTP
jgi:DNA-binding MarR family transcriptional regulator